VPTPTASELHLVRFDELLGLVGVGVGVLALDRRAVVLLAADLAELGLDGHAHGDWRPWSRSR
jgi:hypothetical protein